MPKPYSLDLRARVLKDCDNGLSSEEAARKYSVSVGTVYGWRKRQRQTGSAAPQEYRHGQQLKLAPYEADIRQLVADFPDATLVELHAKLPNKDHVTVPTLHNFLKRLKISWKKKYFALPNSIATMLPKSVKNGSSFKKSLM